MVEVYTVEILIALDKYTPSLINCCDIILFSVYFKEINNRK